MTRKNKASLRIAAASAIALAGAGFSLTSYAGSGTINVGASIITPITVSQGAALEFGSIAPSGSAGTVVITAAASPTVTPTGVTLVNQGATRAAARVDLTASAAESGYTYSVTAMTGTTTTLTSGANTMTVDNYTLSASTGTLSGTGTGSYYVGGTLNVGANQAPGTYAGTFTATVDYQ